MYLVCLLFIKLGSLWVEVYEIVKTAKVHSSYFSSTKNGGKCEIVKSRLKKNICHSDWIVVESFADWKGRVYFGMRLISCTFVRNILSEV